MLWLIGAAVIFVEMYFRISAPVDHLFSENSTNSSYVGKHASKAVVLANGKEIPVELVALHVAPKGSSVDTGKDSVSRQDIKKLVGDFKTFLDNRYEPTFNDNVTSEPKDTQSSFNELLPKPGTEGGEGSPPEQSKHNTVHPQKQDVVPPGSRTQDHMPQGRSHHHGKHTKVSETVGS